MFVHANTLQDGNALQDGARVCYRKSFDHAKNKDRAEEVTGAYNDPSRAPARPPPGGMGGGMGGGGMGGGGMGGGGGYAFGGGGGGGGPPPGEPPPPPGKQMGSAKRWNMEKGFGASTPTHQLIHPIAPPHSLFVPPRSLPVAPRRSPSLPVAPRRSSSLHAPAVTVAQGSSCQTGAARTSLCTP